MADELAGKRLVFRPNPTLAPVGPVERVTDDHLENLHWVRLEGTP
jgi:hypothetical protein